jgi:GT2 family glycosyltransferase
VGTYGSFVIRKIAKFVGGATIKLWTAFREGRLSLSPLWWFTALGLYWQELGVSGSNAPASPEPMDRLRTDRSYRQWLDSTSREGAGLGEAESRSGFLSIVALVQSASLVADVVESVRAQRFSNWGLWLIWSSAPDRRFDRSGDGLGTGPGNEQRGCVASVSLEEISGADGRWLPPGAGGAVVLLDTGTRLAPGALSQIARAVVESDADWIYTDDDLQTDDDVRSDPNLKGAYSPELTLVDDYATRLAAVRRRTIERVGGLCVDAGDAQIYDLLLRVARAGRVAHSPGVACHRRQTVAGTLGPRHREAAERELGRWVAATLEVNRPLATVPLLTRVKWPAQLGAESRVTIVIPTRDRIDLLERCLASLRRTVDPSRVQILIVDDRSREEATKSWLDEVERDPTLFCHVLRPTGGSDAFNYSRLMNVAASVVDTPLMLHLNNDTEATAPGWVEQLAGWLLVPDIGVVGAKLLHPDGSIQHAGVMVTPPFGPEHMFRRLRGDDPGYQWLPHRLRNVSAVTGACMLTRTAFFRELGGFDEANLPVQFNDIDFCLRAIAVGKRVVYEPAAVLTHQMSASRGPGYDHHENLFFFEKYRGYQDPFVSPLLDPSSICEPTPLLAGAGGDRE